VEGDEETVRLRAYEIWERRGRCGDPVENWLQAERELAGQAEGNAALPSERLTGDWRAALDTAVKRFMSGVRSRARRR
jgi:Protein of unknown function (DUF2934)